MNKDILTPYFTDEYTLERLSSLTNFVYKVSSQTKTLIYRDYSSIFHIFQDREKEVKFQQRLSELNLAPRILYSDNQQRLEEYLPYESVELYELRRDYLQVAKLLGEFHKLNSHQEITEIFEKKASIKVSLTQIGLQDKILEIIQNKAPQKVVDQLRSVFSNEIQSRILKLFESECLKELDLVIAHNDLNLTNFLKNKGQLHLIDFEYAGLNYPGYEIANFFSEMEWDYTFKEYPYFKISKEQGLSEDEKIKFVQTYWETYSGKDQVPQALWEQIQIGYILQNYFWLLIGALSYQFEEQQIDLEYYIKLRIQGLNQNI
ncbi:hypothetical protein pb186bvf_016712 [Paramecium bursaria]